MQINSQRANLISAHAGQLVIRYYGDMPSKTKNYHQAALPREKPSANRMARNTRVLRQFRVVVNAVKAHFRQVEKIAGIGGAQLWALSVIESAPGIGMNDLAQAMDIHQSTASNLVKQLVTQGLVAAARTGADRRVATLLITPKGAKVLHKAPTPFSGVLPDALASLDNHTLTRLERDLGKLILALNADERAANIPLADL